MPQRHFAASSTMDLFAVMEDRETLQCMISDLGHDIGVLEGVKQVAIFGDETLQHEFDTKILKEKIESIGRGAKLWEIQYLFLLIVFLSDGAVDWLSRIVATDQMMVWFDGHSTLPDFRSRFVSHMMGKFSKKAKKGSRKQVLMEATPPQMAAVSEFLLAHTIVSFTQ